MSKFNTAQAIIEALKTEDGKKSFVNEWGEVPRKTDKALRSSLRYQVLEAYFNEPDGVYGEVIEKLLENNIPLRRYENPIYALGDDERINPETEELYLLLGDKKVLYQGREQNLENLEKAVKIYSKYPRAIGRNIEAELLLSTYINDKMDDFYSIVKAGKALPYSSSSTVALFINIVDNNDTEVIDKMIEANPEYMKNLGKVAFTLYKRSFPSNIISYQSSSENRNYRLLENILRYSQEHSQIEIFDYLVDKSEQLGISLNGKVVSWQEDILKVDSGDWGRSRYNIYKTENEKYSRNAFYKNVHTSLIFELFVDYLDSDKEQLPQHTQKYLDKIIDNGMFLSYAEDSIKTWSSKVGGKLQLHQSNIYSNITNGNTPAIEVLLYLKETKDFIFKNSGRILKNELNQEKKYRFFNRLVQFSKKEKKFVETNSPDNPKWSLGFKEGQENDLISVITKNSIYFPKNHKEKSSITRVDSLSLTSLDESSLSKQEALCVFETLVDFRDNDQISKPKYFLKESNFNNPEQLKILLSKDLTNGGKVNPLEFFMYSDKIIESKLYLQDGEVPFSQDENRKQTLLKNVGKFIKKLEKDNSLFIPVGAYKINSYDPNFKSSLFPEAILSPGLGGDIITNLLTEEQIRKFLNPTLLSDIEYDFDISDKTLKNLYMGINRDLTLIDSVKMDAKDQKKYEDIIRKLNNIDFNFDIDPNKPEHALCYVKMFTLIKDENLLEDMFNKNKDKFLACVMQNIEFTNGKNEYILNFSQNKKLLSLFSEHIDLKKLEQLFQDTNSAGTYKNFLKQTEYPLISDEHNLLISAIQNKKYKIVNLLIELNPELSNVASKNNRLPLDYALKDRNCFNDKKSVYFNLVDKDDCEKFISKVISNNIQTPVNNKKALENLAIRFGKENYLNAEQSTLLSKHLIELNMESVAHQNSQKQKSNKIGKNKITPSSIPDQDEDDDFNSVAFKI